MDTVQECFGWFAACLNICFYLTPIVPFINVLKGKLNFEDTPGVYVTCCYVNCFIWYIYGDMIFSDQVKISNCICAIICLVFILKMDNLEDIFGWAALCLNMCIYLTPVLPFINVLKGKVSYEDTPGVLVSATYVNCFCWYIYGDMIFSDQVKICNCIGAIISLCLIVIYLVYEIRKFTLDAILNALIIITGSYATYRGLTIVVDDDAVIGKICNVTAIIVFLNPMYLIYKVIREKNNYILIPIYTAWVSLFAYGLWVIYGIIIKDVYLMVPNVIGIVLSIIQICIYIIFKKKYPTFGEREKDTSTIDIENTGNDDRREDTTIKDDEEIQNNSKGKPVKIVSKLDN